METKLQNSLGFTLIELLVVIAIMIIITGIFLINFNKLQGPRNLKIAQNQLVTDIRKIQSYTLSSRNVGTSGKPARYYMMKFQTAQPNVYVIQAIDKDNTAFDLQTVTLPRTVSISSISVQPTVGSPISANCAQVAFSLPFGRVFMEYKTDASPCNIANTFLNSGDLSANKNLILDVILSDTTSSGPTAQKTIEVNGISQSVEPK